MTIFKDSDMDTKPDTDISSRKFHLFPSLPSEIRLIIWHLCLPGPRVLNILTPDCTCSNPSCNRIHKYHRSGTAHPTLLAVNRESRAETLRSYVLIRGPGMFCLSFNSSKDTVCFQAAGQGHTRSRTVKWPVALVDAETARLPSHRIRSLAISAQNSGSYPVIDLVRDLDLEEIVILYVRTRQCDLNLGTDLLDISGLDWHLWRKCSHEVTCFVRVLRLLQWKGERKGMENVKVKVGSWQMVRKVDPFAVHLGLKDVSRSNIATK